MWGAGVLGCVCVRQRMWERKKEKQRRERERERERDKSEKPATPTKNRSSRKKLTRVGVVCGHGKVIHVHVVKGQGVNRDRQLHEWLDENIFSVENPPQLPEIDQERSTIRPKTRFVQKKEKTKQTRTKKSKR